MARRNGLSPLYQQVRSGIEQQIVGERLAAGDRIPSEYDLCHRYGVSRITVRRALDDLVGEGILHRVAGLGTFVAGASRRQVRIGLATFGFTDAYYEQRPDVLGELLAGFASEAEVSGVFLRILRFPLDAEPAPALRAALDVTPLDGFLVRPFPDLSAAQAAAVNALGVPWVLVKRAVPEAPVHCVVSDDTAGAERAVQHLLDLGHRRIGLVVGAQHVSIFRQRRAGYERALRAAGLEVDDRLIAECPDVLEDDGRLAADRLLAWPRPPTAIFAASDLVAIGVADALLARGLRIPEDCSLVGYGGLTFGERVRPALTTIRTPYHQFGIEATRLLLRVLAGEVRQPTQVEVGAQLVVRASTCPLTPAPGKEGDLGARPEETLLPAAAV